ncbi:MAG TPA: glycosyltransferase family 39 protein, partial [Phycisphaerae bacterium]|nr:glycosyltransferase family 39 protein [Phycisphaerae bacterium]
MTNTDPTVPSFASTRAIVLFSALWCLLLGVMLFGGPALGDHEVIVAQSARQILQSGEWIVLRYLDTPFLVKPPLAPWLVAIASSIFPGGGALHLPVTNFTARLPSTLATALTVWVIAALGRSMFGRRTGAICAFVYATSIGAILYALNSTSEALLTLFCTWSFAEFWWANSAKDSSERRWHLMLFYLALGLAMLAKGPMPAIVVMAPLACWWFLHRPGQLLAMGGVRAMKRSIQRFLRDLWPQTTLALRRLGLWWGLPLFLLPFTPWMIAVARRVPYFLDLLRYEYL